MKPQRISFALILALLPLVPACKKSEETAVAPPAARPERPAAETPKPAASVPPETPPAPTAAAVPSGDAVVLKMKWPVGNRYVYRMDFDQHSTNHMPQLPQPMQQNVALAMTYALSVVKELPNNGRDIEMEFLANEMEVKMGDQTLMSFDSKETGGNETGNPIAAPFRRMIGSKIHLEVNADGRVDKVVGLDEWLQKISGDAGPGAGGMLTQQFNEDYFRQITDFGRSLPDKPVRPGETWPHKMELPAGPLGKMNVDAMVTFKAMEQREQKPVAALGIVGTVTGQAGEGTGPLGKTSVEGGKLSGTSWFDPELGALVESAVDQTMRVKGELKGMPGGAGGGITIDMGQKVTVKLVEQTKK